MNMLPLATSRSCLLLPGLYEAAMKGFAALPEHAGHLSALLLS